MSDEQKFDSESTMFRLIIVGGLVGLVLVGLLICMGVRYVIEFSVGR
jgi:hypothetical protein